MNSELLLCRLKGFFWDHPGNTQLAAFQLKETYLIVGCLFK